MNRRQRRGIIAQQPILRLAKRVDDVIERVFDGSVTTRDLHDLREIEAQLLTIRDATEVDDAKQLALLDEALRVTGDAWTEARTLVLR